MGNYYSTVREVALFFSDIAVDNNGFETIMARFEKTDEKDVFSEWKLPCVFNTRASGFSEEEILEQERYLTNNHTLIWEMAREKSV